MRGLVKWGLVLGVLWSGWWWLASTGMQSAIKAQFDAKRRAGWQIAGETPDSSGFPLTLRQDFTSLRLTDPDQTTIDIPTLSLTAKAYWPGFATITLPDAPIQLTAQDATLALQMKDASADMRLHPGLALELESVALNSGPWQISDASSRLLGADSLMLNATQVTGTPNTYDFNVLANALAPGDPVRAALQLAAETPLTFDAYRADGQVQFDRPLDRRIVGGIAAKPTSLQLNSAEVTWGDIDVKAAADLSIDPDGIPTGTLTTKVVNWQQAIDLAESAGALPSQMRAQASLMLGLMANMSGTRDDIQVTLTAANGQITVNGFPLGPAPSLFAH